jgi:curved DNA-binding protein CbpA
MRGRRADDDDHSAVHVDAVTHYDVLGVAPTAPTSELRRAYVALARQHHPDRDGGDAEAMRAINDAWATLRDPGRRASYDLALRVHTAPSPAPHPGGAGASDVDDLLADLKDDTPFGTQVVLPGWLSLVPVATFAASLAALFVGLVFSSAPALAAAFALFTTSCVLFLMAPFVALLASRRRG